MLINAFIVALSHLHVRWESPTNSPLISMNMKHAN